MATYEIEVEFCDKNEQRATRLITYESEEAARADLTLINEIIKSHARLGSISSEKWLVKIDFPNFTVPLEVLDLVDATDARISQLVSEFGTNVWLKAITRSTL